MLLKRPGITLIAVLTLLLCFPAHVLIVIVTRNVFAQGQESPVNSAAQTVPALEVGKPVERDIKGGEVHLYQITLRSGEFVRGTVEQYVESPKAPLRFYLEAGSFENDIWGGGGDILETSRHLRDVLRAKGYEVQYREFAGGHDYLTWRGSLADGLLALAQTRTTR